MPHLKVAEKGNIVPQCDIDLEGTSHCSNTSSPSDYNQKASTLSTSHGLSIAKVHWRNKLSQPILEYYHRIMDFKIPESFRIF